MGKDERKLGHVLADREHQHDRGLRHTDLDESRAVILHPCCHSASSFAVIHGDSLYIPAPTRKCLTLTIIF